MQKPKFSSRREGDTETLRQEVEEFARKMGDLAGAEVLFNRAVVPVAEKWQITTAETPIPHGKGYVPRWGTWGLEGNANVYQSKDPDTRFLYLVASANVTTGLWVG